MKRSPRRAMRLAFAFWLLGRLAFLPVAAQETDAPAAGNGLMAPLPSPSASPGGIASADAAADRPARLMMTVAPAEGAGDFQSVQAAVDAVPPNDSRPVTILVKPGTYKDRIRIPPDKSFITLRGEDAETTVLTYDLKASDHDPKAPDPGPDSQRKTVGTSGSASVFIDGNDFTAENITFENAAGNHGQAVAVNVTGQRCAFYRCRFLGWQDTVYLKAGRQFFQDCYIAGGVDFIFGAGVAFFDRCHLHSLAPGYLTAASTLPEAKQGYVFSHCRITADTGPGTVYLGRPWRPYSSVAYLHTEMPDAIRPVGWDNWRSATNEKTARYAEYGSFGLGADAAARAPWSHQLTEAEALALTPESVLGGSDNWKPLHRYGPDVPWPKVARPTIPERVFNVVDYGAVGDGKTLNTAAFARTMDECKSAGGGIVRVPEGQFLTGPLSLSNNMNLRVEAGGVVLLSNDPKDFPLVRHRYVDAISADGCHDIAITGRGAIDGQGQPWWEQYRKRRPGEPSPAVAPDDLPHRPHLVVLKNCQRVLIQDIALRNSPMFHLVPEHCEDVTVDGLRVNAPSDAPNTDGFDPSGKRYLIVRSSFDTGDDNIAFKPSYGREDARPEPACEDFTVADCVFLHGHGLSIGGQTPGGMKNLSVRDCRFEETQAGIRMKANRGSGGLVDGLVYENLTMNRVKTAILITSYYPTIPSAPEKDKEQPVTALTPIWRNVQIRNVTAEGGSVAGRIIGLPEMDVSNITLEHVDISADKGMDIVHAKDIRFVDSDVKVKRGAPLTVKEAKITGLENLLPAEPAPATAVPDEKPAAAESPSDVAPTPEPANSAN